LKRFETNIFETFSNERAFVKRAIEKRQLLCTCILPNRKFML